MRFASACFCKYGLGELGTGAKLQGSLSQFFKIQFNFKENDEENWFKIWISRSSKQQKSAAKRTAAAIRNLGAAVELVRSCQMKAIPIAML